MNVTVKLPQQIHITHIHISIPVRYDEEDISKDFPLRNGDLWEALVNIDTGKIEDWPKNACEQYRLSMKVCDEGTYTLLSDTVPNGVKRFTQVAKLEQQYVPNGVVPGQYGDYVDLHITDGVITNWPKQPNVRAFFGEEDDE